VPWDFVVKNASKTRSGSCSGSPIPESLTAISICPSAVVAARIEKILAGDGIVLFEASRRFRSCKAEDATEGHLHDQGKVDPRRGSLS
jgi:hypothetical protein